MSTAPRTSTISVIIPAWNEADNLERTLTPLRDMPGLEVIVVDAGSSDRTCAISEAHGARVVNSAPGRALQQNLGAREAVGEILLFLHADTILPEGFENAVRQCLAKPGVAAGAFRLNINGSGRSLRIVESLANWRSRRLQMPYGDQALFIRRKTFTGIGGFPEQEIMEDFELVRRLKERGRIELLELAVRTSDRRWRKLGVIRTTLINQAIIIAYYLGFSPYSLASWYRSSSRFRR